MYESLKYFMTMALNGLHIWDDINRDVEQLRTLLKEFHNTKKTALKFIIFKIDEIFVKEFMTWSNKIISRIESCHN